MYLPSESTHRGSPLVAVHAHQALLVGARAKGSAGKEVMQPGRVEHTSFGVLGSLQRLVLRLERAVGLGPIAFQETWEAS